MLEISPPLALLATGEKHVSSKAAGFRFLVSKLDENNLRGKSLAGKNRGGNDLV